MSTKTNLETIASQLNAAIDAERAKGFAMNTDLTSKLHRAALLVKDAILIKESSGREARA